MDRSIECVEGTGGSGTSEITQNIYTMMQNQGNYRVNNSEMPSVQQQSQELKMIDQSLEN